MLLVHPLNFSAIFNHFNVLNNIHEYENKIICISDHQVKVLCLGMKFDTKFSVLG